MKNVILILFFVATSICLSCNKKQERLSQPQESVDQQTPTIEVIGVSAFEKGIIQDGAQLIDVRTIEEWEDGHLKNANHFQINNARWEDQIATLDKNKPVYIYCAKGGRSARSAKQLKNVGFTQIYDLEGGITAWKEEGKPVE